MPGQYPDINFAWTTPNEFATTMQNLKGKKLSGYG